DHGARQIMASEVDEFFYVTLMNERYPQMPISVEASAAIIKGMHRLSGASTKAQVRLLGSGAVLREVIAASDLLQRDWSVPTEVWSVTSFSELAREAREVDRWNRLHPE